MSALRYEANIDGSIEPGDPFTKFNESSEMTRIFSALGWEPELIYKGVGGYNVYDLFINGLKRRLHIYLKKLTFGGRAKRPFEKRAQFSASLDRRGLEVHQDERQSTVFFALYKRNTESGIVLTAWEASDWGYNSGKAFNCFVDIRSVGHAAREGFSQHVTAKNQIACSFHPEFLNLYLIQKEELHAKKFLDAELRSKNLALSDNASKDAEGIPEVTPLIRITVNVLKESITPIEARSIESNVIKLLNLEKFLALRGESAIKQLSDRLAWARFYLKRVQLIELIGESSWCLTEAAQGIAIDPIAIKRGEVK
jgi:hypothetical protein